MKLNTLITYGFAIISIINLNAAFANPVCGKDRVYSERDGRCVVKCEYKNMGHWDPIRNKCSKAP